LDILILPIIAPEYYNPFT